MRRGGSRWAVIAWMSCLWIAAAPAPAAEWAPVSEAEKAMQQAPGYPEASAVVLFDRGVMRIDKEARSSSLDVYTRIKILKEDGLDYANGELLSSRFVRLRDLAGRTHTADGRIVELPPDATFTQTFSERYRRRVHTFAMPEVEVGAIVEYRYRLYFDGFTSGEPWYFQALIPTLRSEITLDKPSNMGFLPVPLVNPQFELQMTTADGPQGKIPTYALDNLPPIPDEPFSYPFEDLASQIRLVPQEIYFSGQVVELFKDWGTTLEYFDDFVYGPAQRKDRKAKAKAKELMSGKSAPRDRAAAIYGFVRDEIALEPLLGVTLPETTCDKVLGAGRGDFMEKVLLLDCMLDGAGFDSRIGWARPRNLGRVHRAITTPYQFELPLVEVFVGGERLFLDPSSPRLAFGALRASLEGTDCLLVSPKEPEWAVLPESAAEDNQRRVTLELAIGDDGGVTGGGAMTLTGLHAQRELEPGESAETVRDEWREWLEERFPGYELSEVTVEEDAAARRIEVRWKQTLAAAEVLGDEVTLYPARPFAIDDNPFTIEPPRRQTPVLLSFRDSDQLELTLRWPAGWSVEGKPRVAKLSNPAGSIVTAAEIVPAESTLRYSRRLDITDTDFSGPGEYNALYALYDMATRSDAETFVLVRE